MAMVIIIHTYKVAQKVSPDQIINRRY